MMNTLERKCAECGATIIVIRPGYTPSREWFNSIMADPRVVQGGATVILQCPELECEPPALCSACGLEPEHPTVN
jgi:hypothetical protein